MQPFSGNQRPDLLTALMNMSLVLRLPRKMHLSRSCSNVPRLPSFLETLQTFMVCSLLTRSTIPCACHAKRHLNVQKWFLHVVFFTFWLRNVLRATTACIFSTSQLPKVVRSCGVLYILTWKCVSCHNGVHFFDIPTSKSGPELKCFVHFDLEMCFGPQQRALFRHLNFQKWSGDVVLCAFWLGNVLRATTACNFSSLIWPAGSAPADLASLLFDPLEPQIVGKHCVSRLSFLLHLCFSSVHIVGSWTSKLPSNGYHWLWPTPEAKKWYSPILLEEWWITSICIERLRGKPKNFGLPTSELVRLLPVSGFTESFLDVFSMHDFWIWPVVGFAQQKPPAPVDPMFPHWDLVCGLEHELYFSIQLGIS